jgi:hypothetical protein
MAKQGELSKENAATCKEAVDEMFKALPKTKQMNFIGHLNDVFLFLETGIRELPSKP